MPECFVGWWSLNEEGEADSEKGEFGFSSPSSPLEVGENTSRTASPEFRGEVTESPALCRRRAAKALRLAGRWTVLEECSSNGLERMRVASGVEVGVSRQLGPGLVLKGMFLSAILSPAGTVLLRRPGSNEDCSC